MIRLRFCWIAFVALSGLSIHLATDLAHYRSMGMFDGQAKVESMMLGVTGGSIVILASSVCRLWLRRALQATRDENQFSRANVNRETRANSVFHVEPADDDSTLAEQDDTLRWWMIEYKEERVWEAGRSVKGSIERIRR